MPPATLRLSPSFSAHMRGGASAPGSTAAYAAAVLICVLLAPGAGAICKSCDGGFVALAAMGGTGSRSVAMLLDRMGVFMTTGGHECTDRTTLACVRTTHDPDSACSDTHLDYHMSGWSGLVQSTKSAYYARTSVDSGAWEGAMRNVATRVTSAQARSARCVGMGPWETEAKFVGIKHQNVMMLLPLINEAADGRMVVVHLVRGVEDTVTSANTNSLKEFYPALTGKDWGSCHGNYACMAGAWARVNLEVAAAAVRVVGYEGYLLVRYEDLVTTDMEWRARAVQRIVDRFYRTGAPSATIAELCNVFDVPIDAKGGDFAATHHHRWDSLNEEQLAEVRRASAAGKEAFGYNHTSPIANDGGVLELDADAETVAEGVLNSWKEYLASENNR